MRSEMGPSAGMTIATSKPLGSEGAVSGLKQRLRGTRFCGKRDIDDEDATLAGHIADADLAAVRPYCFPSDRESQAEARSISATPIAKCLKRIALAQRN